MRQVGSNRAQIVTQQLGEFRLLLLSEILGTFEQQPARALEHRLVALGHKRSRLLSPHLVERFVHLGHDVEAVEYVNGTSRFPWR